MVESFYLGLRFESESTNFFRVDNQDLSPKADSDRLLDPQQWISTLMFELNFKFQPWQFGSMLIRYVNVKLIEEILSVQHAEVK